MRTRLGMIGDIRNMIDTLYGQSRFAEAKEILSELDRFDFSGVSDSVIRKLYEDLSRATAYQRI